MTLQKRILFGVVLLVLYLASSVPVGLFIYSLKSGHGLNIFERTGFHAYLQCLYDQAAKVPAF